MEEFKVICIDTTEFLSESGKVYSSEPLVEGKIYTASSDFIDDDGDRVYYIVEESHNYLSKRFKKVDTSFSDKLVDRIENHFRKQELAIAA